MNLLALFWAEMKREFILTFRYPFELVSRLVWNLGFALMIYYGFGAVGNSLPGFEEGQLGRLLGLLITFIAMNGLNNATELLAEETQTGTLEQAALSPPPLVVIMLLRDIASLIEMLLRFILVMAIAIGITGAKFHLDFGSFALLLSLMYFGLEGIGMMLGGAALLYKKIATLAQFAMMLIFGLAVLPLESLPGWMSAFVHHFPFTQALILLRESAIQGVPLSTQLANGSIASLALTASLFLALGIVTFTLAERKARDWGTLNQY